MRNYLTEYDPAEILVTYGPKIIEGFQPGTFVSVTKPDDSWSGESGQAGEGEFVKHNQSWYEVTITLMSGSQSNTDLQEYLTSDANGRAPALVLDIKNNLGLELFNSAKSRIKKAPDVVFSDTADGKAWTFLCYKPQLSAGGHTEI